MIVVGIDTSLTATGIAVLDTDRDIRTDPAAMQTFTVGARKPDARRDPVADIVSRVNRLREQIDHVVHEARPDAIGIEALAYGAKGAGVWVLPWVYGEALRIVDLASPHRAVTRVSTTARAKYATGKGNSPKDAVLLTAAKLFPHADLRDNNEADAAIVAAVVAHRWGAPVLPATAYRDDVIAGLDKPKKAPRRRATVGG